MIYCCIYIVKDDFFIILNYYFRYLDNFFGDFFILNFWFKYILGVLFLYLLLNKDIENILLVVNYVSMIV